MIDREKALTAEIRNIWADVQAELNLHPCEPPLSFVLGCRAALERRDPPSCPYIVVGDEGTHYCRLNGPPAGDEERVPRERVQKALEALTFDDFRKANVTRCVKWHPEGIESWSPSDWLTAVTGELGELASLLKMRNRERDGLAGNKFSPTDKQIADEIADVFTYLDLLAEALGIDLGQAVERKFNEVSKRVGFDDRIIRQALTSEERVLERIERVLDALDEYLGDSDVDHFESDDELRVEEPVQWAHKELRALLLAAAPDPEQEEV